MLPRYLVYNEATARTEKICKHCEKSIEKNDRYISVNVQEIFLKKGFGAFHLQCFRDYQQENNIKICTQKI